MAEYILSADGLSKSFPVRGGVLRRQVGQIDAVLDVTLGIGAGERVGLVGESGSGKSTLAKLLVGLLPPTQGCVRIGSLDVSRLGGKSLKEIRRRVALIFQDPTNSLNPRMSVEEIVSEPLIIHRLTTRRERRDRVMKLLEAVQLPRDYCLRLPRELSGGERQRVGLARALATDPEILICDEPIASLDVSVGAKMLNLLLGLSNERKMAMLFISHDLRAVAFICRRIAVMSKGRLVEEGETDELLAHPKKRYTEVLINSAELDLDAVPELDDGEAL